MHIPAHTDALLFVPRRTAMPWRQDEAGADRNRFDAVEKPEIGRDVFDFYNHGGSLAVAGAWLVIYAVAVLPPFVAWSVSLITSLL